MALPGIEGSHQGSSLPRSAPDPNFQAEAVMKPGGVALLINPTSAFTAPVAGIISTPSFALKSKAGDERASALTAHSATSSCARPLRGSTLRAAGGYAFSTGFTHNPAANSFYLCSHVTRGCITKMQQPLAVPPHC